MTPTLQAGKVFMNPRQNLLRLALAEFARSPILRWIVILAGVAFIAGRQHVLGYGSRARWIGQRDEVVCTKAVPQSLLTPAIRTTARKIVQRLAPIINREVARQVSLSRGAAMIGQTDLLWSLCLVPAITFSNPLGIPVLPIALYLTSTSGIIPVPVLHSCLIAFWIDIVPVLHAFLDAILAAQRQAGLGRCIAIEEIKCGRKLIPATRTQTRFHSVSLSLNRMMWSADGVIGRRSDTCDQHALADTVIVTQVAS